MGTVDSLTLRIAHQTVEPSGPGREAPAVGRLQSEAPDWFFEGKT